MKIFSHSQYSLLSKSIHSEEGAILKRIAEQYISLGEHHKALSDFLISGLSHQWKSSDVQSQIFRITEIKPLGHKTISATHFRLVYQAQYQSEFFKNPRSTMRQAILKNGEKHFDENTNMVEIIDGNKNSSNRTSEVLRKLGA